MDQTELYVPAREQRQSRVSMGLARLWFVVGMLFIAYFLWMWLSHLGEGVARDYFDVALFGGLAWWGAWHVVRWVARGFAR